jgi:hypothetical protein
LIQNIDELQGILGELFFTFKENIGTEDDILTKVIKGNIEKKKEIIQERLFDL